MSSIQSSIVFVLMVMALGIGAYHISVPSHWIAIGTVALVDLGILSGVATSSVGRQV
jgi:hypothetical protein